MAEENNSEMHNVAQSEIDSLKERLNAYNAGNQDEKIPEPTEWTPEECEMIKAKLPTDNKTPEENSKPEITEKSVSKKGKTLKVDGASTSVVEGEENADWIAKKREFWKKFAEDNHLILQNDAQKDTAEHTFSAVLLQNADHPLGEIKYTSPQNVSVSTNASLAIYQGLVKDALSSEQSITFGSGLDDTQKAMLMAACLMNKDTYQNGQKVEMVNAPTIDPNAEYFKKLPEEVRKTLQDYLKQQEIQTKLEQVRGKLTENAAKEPSTDRSDKRYALRQEQIELMKDSLSPEEQQARLQKEGERERIRAARLGYTQAEYRQGQKKGQPVAADSKYKEYAAEHYSPEYLSALQAKYAHSGQDGK